MQDRTGSFFIDKKQMGVQEIAMAEKQLSLREQLEYFLNEELDQVVISGPRDKKDAARIRLRPLYLREKHTDQGANGVPSQPHGQVMFQAEELRGQQAFHKNFPREETIAYILEAMGRYRQLEASSKLGSMHVLVSKAGKQTVKVKKAYPLPKAKIDLSHNRRKHYILEEGRPVPFLIDLGVMTKEGKIVNACYDKFRQINRFLEFIEDVLPRLPKGREVRIIDFGCGKSYLTFAVYYYLHELRGLDVRITGLDRKEEVMEHCGYLAEKYGYEKLTFLHGDIADFAGTDQADMVVTLHACDTATDYALAKAVSWNASVILSVPCCQHELNKQMENELMTPIFHYGIIKERMAALYTDALRAEILENHGYRTQVLEFIDMEHTPKNLLLRCVRDGRRKDNGEQIRAIVDFLGVEPTLLGLLGVE